MKKLIRFCPIVIILQMGIGCSSTLPAPFYSPISPVYYTKKSTHAVQISEITDNRGNADPEVFFINDRDPFKAKFNVPVSDIVAKALRVELRKFGMMIIQHPTASHKPQVILECDILQFSCRESSTGFAKNNHLTFFVELRFRWRNPSTGQVISENTRMRRFTHPSKFPKGFDSSTSFMHMKELNEYVKVLVQVLLPDVIRQETRNNPVINN
ncbi:MAG: hypothetical protein H8E27_13420 [Verrucomicrobia subdivision 3 bacterium]|nr:hypothetical protein [Limisphaerales bacterium]